MAEPGQVGSLSPESLAAIRVVFFQECEEHLADLEAGLSALDRGESEPDTVNAVFRAVHSIKGGAGIFDLTALVQFAHRFETALAEVRSGRLVAEQGTIRVLLRAADVLSDLVQAARDGQPVEPARAAAAGDALAALSPPPEPQEDPFDDVGFEVRPVAFKPIEDLAPTGWRIRFRPYAGLYAKANEPLVMLRELGRLGGAKVTLDDRDLPPLEALDPDQAYLAWNIELPPDHSEADIREVFEFVEDDCDLEILRAGAPAAAAGATADDSASSPIAALAPMPVAAPNQTIRVDLDRVERLVNLVSELVINQAMLTERIWAEDLSRRNGVAAALDDLDQLTRDLQDSVMSIRAQPVKAVFQRMSRLVREAEVATGKRVRLVTEGESTEIDRTVIERLTEPLTHMVRNAVDHGVETPQRREALGKPPEGVVRIAASHRGGRIVIEVSDDGEGVDRQRIRAKAIERGVVAADAVLGDEDIDELIFAPGFSTAENVSDLSGRGVGMDVVRKSVQALGGRITVRSSSSEGTTFVLTLPLTLAVLDGMLVSVRGQHLVAPLTTLIETVQLRTNDVRRLGPHTALLAIRGAHVPLIDLGRLLDYRGPAPEPAAQPVALLVEGDAGERAALLVDDVLGQRQVVIKSLEANYRPVDGVAAATILGDGRVALILDVNAILARQHAHAGANNAAA
ncbi:MAG TPA: chemotaxis protein CheA [Caulobacteraceae bacterium]|nr:chemotaxis protein CheA [Caulobacteraceae bacterium]